MLAKLLRHNGIDLSDDEENSSPIEGSMEVEHQMSTESGTKRLCSSHQRSSSQLSQNLLSPLANQNLNHV